MPRRSKRAAGSEKPPPPNRFEFWGHESGDRLLQGVAHHLLISCGCPASLCRLGLTCRKLYGLLTKLPFATFRDSEGRTLLDAELTWPTTQARLDYCASLHRSLAKRLEERRQQPSYYFVEECGGLRGARGSVVQQALHFFNEQQVRRKMHELWEEMYKQGEEVGGGASGVLADQASPGTAPKPKRVRTKRVRAAAAAPAAPDVSAAPETLSRPQLILALQSEHGHKARSGATKPQLMALLRQLRATKLDGGSRWVCARAGGGGGGGTTAVSTPKEASGGAKAGAGGGGGAHRTADARLHLGWHAASPASRLRTQRCGP
jgi:hypothetical protein